MDPLEGTSITAKGGPNAMAVVALAEKGGFLHAPDIYMDKIAVGPGLPDGVVHLDAPPRRTCASWRRPRSARSPTWWSACSTATGTRSIIKACRAAGARIMLIPDGDVSGVVAVAQPEAGVDMYMGSGGAPEGVLAAAALRCIGGQMQGRLLFENEEQVARARGMGVADPNRQSTSSRTWRSGEVMFAATGVTTGPMLRGVRRYRQRRDDPFHRHAQQVRHGALRRGAPQFRAEARRLRRPDGLAAASTRGRPRGSGRCSGVARSVTGRRWVWRDGEARAGLAIAQRLDAAGTGRPAAGGARHRGGGGGGLPRAHPARAAARPLRCWSTWTRPPRAWPRGAAAARPSAVFGDYDVDGACSGALMVRAAAPAGLQVTHYVPRPAEGGLRARTRPPSARCASAAPR